MTEFIVDQSLLNQAEVDRIRTSGPDALAAAQAEQSRLPQDKRQTLAAWLHQFLDAVAA